MSARETMEQELSRLERQRARYLLAAHTTTDRKIALRRLLAVERLDDEIEGLRQALVALDELTSPLVVHDDGTIPVFVGASGLRTLTL